jgi:hypothetical protein
MTYGNTEECEGISVNSINLVHQTLAWGDQVIVEVNHKRAAQWNTQNSSATMQLDGVS